MLPEAARFAEELSETALGFLRNIPRPSGCGQESNIELKLIRAICEDLYICWLTYSQDNTAVSRESVVDKLTTLPSQPSAGTGTVRRVTLLAAFPLTCDRPR